MLASLALFLAGGLVQRPMARFSAAWFWSAAMTLLGLAALVGGIDHGFVEPAGLPRFAIQRGNWLVLNTMTFCVLMTTAMQFFGRRGRRVLLALALLQLAASALATLTVDRFAIVMANYAPVMALFLAMNMLGLRRGTGSGALAAGIGVLFAASAVQASGIQRFSPLDHNGLYHLIAMPGLWLLARGARTLRTTLDAPAAAPRRGHSSGRPT